MSSFGNIFALTRKRSPGVKFDIEKQFAEHFPELFAPTWNVQDAPSPIVIPDEGPVTVLIAPGRVLVPDAPSSMPYGPLFPVTPDEIERPPAFPPFAPAPPRFIEPGLSDEDFRTAVDFLMQKTDEGEERLALERNGEGGVGPADFPVEPPSQIEVLPSPKPLPVVVVVGPPAVLHDVPAPEDVPVPDRSLVEQVRKIREGARAVPSPLPIEPTVTTPMPVPAPLPSAEPVLPMPGQPAPGIRIAGLERSRFMSAQLGQEPTAAIPPSDIPRVLAGLVDAVGTVNAIEKRGSAPQATNVARWRRKKAKGIFDACFPKVNELLARFGGFSGLLGSMQMALAENRNFTITASENLAMQVLLDCVAMIERETSGGSILDAVVGGFGVIAPVAAAAL